MTWKMHKVVLRLLTPLHIGHMKLGNVQRTRHYVTGKALWGALTARLTRDNPGLGGAKGNESKRYENVGSLVNRQLVFSYFYPAVGEEVKPFPWDNADEFAWRYLNTYASTALNYSHNSAEEGSLHETEYIAPHTRDGQPVNLVGYIFERDDCALNWRAALSRLQLGGERTYGWGRVHLENDPAESESFWSGWTVELDHDKPRLRAQNDKPMLYAHTDARGMNVVKGHVEPLLGRETQEAGAHGKVLKDARVCWMPGAQVAKDAWLQICNYGIWQAVGD